MSFKFSLEKAILPDIVVKMDSSSTYLSAAKVTANFGVAPYTYSLNNATYVSSNIIEVHTWECNTTPYTIRVKDSNNLIKAYDFFVRGDYSELSPNVYEISLILPGDIIKNVALYSPGEYYPISTYSLADNGTVLLTQADFENFSIWNKFYTFDFNHTITTSLVLSTAPTSPGYWYSGIIMERP
jgi:hypothetical protein